jgi:hypothetical protein
MCHEQEVNELKAQCMATITDCEEKRASTTSALQAELREARERCAEISDNLRMETEKLQLSIKAQAVL